VEPEEAAEGEDVVVLGVANLVADEAEVCGGYGGGVGFGARRDGGGGSGGSDSSGSNGGRAYRKH
jgi:hypothetical protein